jgi:hypothetical protein
MIIHCENAWRAPPLATQLLETSAVPPSRDRWYFVSLSARRDQRRSNHIPNAGNRHDAVKYIGTVTQSPAVARVRVPSAATTQAR